MTDARMRPMAKSLGGFRAALAAGWIALVIAGLLVARAKAIPLSTALPIVAAFLLESPFYLAVGFPAVRERLAGARLPAILAVSAVLPYLACSLGAIPFHWTALAQLAAVAAGLGLWYVVLPVNIATDAGFLLLIAFLMIGKYFDTIYPEVYRQKLSILGTLALFHISALVLILERRVPETGFGFWPHRREWLQGVLHYLYFLVLGAPLALALGAVHFTRVAPWWSVAATFVGFFWVVALWEEFMFRGVLQQWMEHWMWSRLAALLLTSAIFGAVHLWFRGFPNWKWALTAAVLGIACGRARNHTGNIRAGVITHALVVATLRAFFS
jgi:membrane protease YdiL (CAAX protease family)